ncbi:MAG: four helix bundle protein [Prolixibacteraceae bacterium]|jgi:four helix bundle protein|nr:four helix bundle protein [Prolixibacteraceae bacterium]
MKQSVLRDKSYIFALEIVKICRTLANVEKEYVLSRQLLKSGTSIGALIREAEHAQSSADFISKMSISLKEANETEYWIMLLRDSNLIDATLANQLILSNTELIRMLVATIKTSKNKHSSG